MSTDCWMHILKQIHNNRSYTVKSVIFIYILFFPPLHLLHISRGAVKHYGSTVLCLQCYINEIDFSWEYTVVIYQALKVKQTLRRWINLAETEHFGEPLFLTTSQMQYSLVFESWFCSPTPQPSIWLSLDSFHHSVVYWQAYVSWCTAVYSWEEWVNGWMSWWGPVGLNHTNQQTKTIRWEHLKAERCTECGVDSQWDQKYFHSMFNDRESFHSVSTTLPSNSKC